MAPRNVAFDLVLDRWPAGPQGRALQSLVDDGEVTATRLPRGFVGLVIHHTQTLVYIEAGRPHVRQVLPEPRAVGRRLHRTSAA